MNTVATHSATILLVTLMAVPMRAQEIRTPAPPAAAATPAVPKQAPQDYVIGPDDVLHVFYWRESDLTAEVVVRPDGYISLPLLRDVPALGLTPEQLGRNIQKLAEAYLERPTVTVVVRQINSRKAYIAGEVIRPGSYPLSGPTTVLQLIAMAGGITAFARQDRIVIVRAGEHGPVTIPFSYRKVMQLKDLSTNILLLPGDTILVP